jgi:hypothetical protein
MYCGMWHTGEQFFCCFDQTKDSGSIYQVLFEKAYQVIEFRIALLDDAGDVGLLGLEQLHGLVMRFLYRFELLVTRRMKTVLCI